MTRKEEAEKLIVELEKIPDKRIYFRAGYGWKGTTYREIDRSSDWKKELRDDYSWACIVEVDRNTDEEIRLTGYSVNDME